MTEPMLERVAKALWLERPRYFIAEQTDEETWAEFWPWYVAAVRDPARAEGAHASDIGHAVAKARRILEAMRDPTPRMVDAGNAVVADTHECCVHTMWWHMLDAALDEEGS